MQHIQNNSWKLYMCSQMFKKFVLYFLTNDRIQISWCCEQVIINKYQNDGEGAQNAEHNSVSVYCWPRCHTHHQSSIKILGSFWYHAKRLRRSSQWYSRYSLHIYSMPWGGMSLVHHGCCLWCWSLVTHVGGLFLDPFGGMSWQCLAAGAVSETVYLSVVLLTASPGDYSTEVITATRLAILALYTSHEYKTVA